MTQRRAFLLLFLVTLVARPCAAQVRIDSEAYSGTPFGVGRVTVVSGGGEIRFKGLPAPGGPRGGRIVDLAKRLVEQPGAKDAVNLAGAELTLTEKTQRVYFPVFEKRERPLLREFLTVPSTVTMLFLFQGDAPLDLTVYAPQATAGPVRPRRDPAARDRLLQVWWRDYAAAAGAASSKEYPPLVEEYLTDTLSRRLRLPVPERPRTSSLFETQLNLLAGTEAARIEIARAALLEPLTRAADLQPLPEELPLPEPEVLTEKADTPIEPLAMHVPVECLYARFGSFPNFLWLRHRMEEWGGELRDLISERGLDYDLSQRFQSQIGLKENALGELLGDRVIADVAFIGTDTFMREGAALGTLFQAKNSAALAADLMNQRTIAAKAAGPDARQEQVSIAGHKVSFFSTPDNRLRSFYAQDGDFHLVTTSRKLVEWFYETGSGDHPSLGASSEFQYARSLLPLTRDDTVFAYLSQEFFQNLLSPSYQIESTRRMRSAVEIELTKIAQLAAKSEGKPAVSLEDLVAGGFLPEGFATRVDSSALVAIGKGWGDSLRGGRGTYAPVPDVNVDKVTPRELSDYERFARYYADEFGPMEPVVAAISRKTLDGDLERVVVDLRAAPLSKKHSQLAAGWLGQPTDQRLAAVPGDAVSFEAVLRGGIPLPGVQRAGAENHLFGALRDADPTMASDPRTSLITRLFLSQLEGLNGYVGSWPDPGFLSLLSGLGNPPPDANGFSRSRLGVWRRQFDQFTLLSFNPDVLQLISPQLQFVKAERPAQVWFHAEDLSKTRLAPLLNAYGYRQSKQIVQGNTRFMQMLSDQLHVPPAEARKTAEELLNAKLIDPLGGDYELRQSPGGLQAWVSTVLAQRGTSDQPPKDYWFPALDWLRGIDFELAYDQGMLAAHGELVMPAQSKAPGGGFPFSLPFGRGNAAPAEPKPSATAAPEKVDPPPPVDLKTKLKSLLPPTPPAPKRP